MDQGCDTKEQRERGMRMLRWIKGVTLRNRERENENVEVDQGCDTKEQRERRNENVEVDQGCDTKEQRERE